MQRHEYSVDIDATIDEVWEVFWHRAPDRRQHGKSAEGEVRIDILHPGDEQGNGLVRTCWFPVPKWLLSGGVGRSWEWLTEVKPKESWRYDAVGKPLWSHATGRTRLEDLGGGRTRIHFSEEYEAFNPVMQLLFERSVHKAISRSNDGILAKLEMGVRYHRKRRAREAAEAGP
jgi:polyketide cyclase/dehydrase/lipid transport protein